MRLWSLHPRYLDARGLTACWREGLLARRVLEGHTRGYRSHPQLDRFRGQADPLAAVDAYLHALYREACCRGYCFDRGKMGPLRPCAKIEVSDEQVAFERRHLLVKLALRDPERYVQLNGETRPETHPLFVCVPGGIESWEKQGYRSR